MHQSAIKNHPPSTPPPGLSGEFLKLILSLFLGGGGGLSVKDSLCSWCCCGSSERRSRENERRSRERNGEEKIRRLHFHRAPAIFLQLEQQYEVLDMSVLVPKASSPPVNGVLKMPMPLVKWEYYYLPSPAPETNMSLTLSLPRSES